MSATSFAEQYKHPNWQRVRLQMLELAGWECQNCGATEATLHVHHRRYIKGRAVWQYTKDELMVLCDSCHETIHSAKKSVAELIDLNGPEYWGEALGLMRGYMDGCVALAAFVENALSDPRYRLGVIASMLSMLHDDELKALVVCVARGRPLSPAMNDLAENWARR